jgi:hypothetical protein
MSIHQRLMRSFLFALAALLALALPVRAGTITLTVQTQMQALTPPTPINPQ